ncbi:MAG TPA: folate-binding protein, partial [Thiotrichales bacterium]|nr:folate-binding protein [Thiotrichales bacterium]
KKGCYTGQEIVARMHYLGKLKKRMYKIHIDAHGDTAPQSGDPVFAENASAGQNTGMLIDAQVNPDGGYDALAVLQIADSQARLKLHDSNGPVIHVEALPYSLEPEASS